MSSDKRSGFSLQRSLDEHLTGLGYRKLPLKKCGAMLFFKHRGDIYLTLGIETSKHFYQRFTGSFYLAPTLSWGYAVRDFPWQAYARIGSQLTPAQRKQVDPNATGAQVDVWWLGFTPENTLQFAGFVRLVEERFWRDARLIERVKSCALIRELLSMIAAVHGEMVRSRISKNPLLPQVKTDPCVPARWYLAAASVAKQFPDFNQKHGIKMLAEQSWLLHEFA